MTASITLESASPEQTAQLGSALADLIEPGDWVALIGPLGAGKTHLVRALAQSLGVEAGLVSSPTYVLINAYPTAVANNTDPPTTIVHVDAYRLGGSEDLDNLGWDALAEPRIMLIEWADRIADALPDEAARVTIEPTGESSRSITLDLPDAWLARAGYDRLDRLATRSETICPVTGLPVSADSPTWPFASERARMADLHQWFSGGHRISRPIEQRDLDED